MDCTSSRAAAPPLPARRPGGRRRSRAAKCVTPPWLIAARCMSPTASLLWITQTGSVVIHRFATHCGAPGWLGVQWNQVDKPDRGRTS